MLFSKVLPLACLLAVSARGQDPEPSTDIGNHSQQCLQAMDDIAMDTAMKQIHDTIEATITMCEDWDIDKAGCSKARSDPLKFNSTCVVDCVNDSKYAADLQKDIDDYEAACQDKGNIDDDGDNGARKHDGTLCEMDMIVEYPNGGVVTWKNHKVLCIPKDCDTAADRETIRQQLERGNDG